MVDDQVGGSGGEGWGNTVTIENYLALSRCDNATAGTSVPGCVFGNIPELVQVAADRRSLIIVTGIAMGPVHLDIDLLDTPGDSQLAPTVDTGVTGPVLTPRTPGVHNFGISVDDRQSHYDQFVETPVESYRIWFWPS